MKGCLKRLLAALLGIPVACIGLVILVLIFQSEDDSSVADLPTLASFPTFTPTNSMTPTLTATLTSTISPTPTASATITNTPLPTSTPRPTFTRQPTSPPSGTTYYSEVEGANTRRCPELNCEVIAVLSFAESIEILDSSVDGAVFNGNSRWMEGIVNGQVVYVHSSLVSFIQPSAPPVAPQTFSGNTSNTSSSGGTGGTNNVRPANCTEARAMGLTAQQAAQWDHLDRDNDGVACYGD